MKKWYIYLISVIIAACTVGYILAGSIHFTDTEAVSATPAVSADISPVTTEVVESPDVADKDTESKSEYVKDSEPSSIPVTTATPAVKETVSVSATPYLPVEVLSTPEPVNSEALPVISVSDESVPETVTINNVVNIIGIISTDSGILTEVSAEICRDGETVQSCIYSTNESIFSLAGTVNADLHFAQLSTGDYRYILRASAENNTGTSSVTLTDTAFSVVPAGSAKAAESDGGTSLYVAQLSPDIDNAAIIWNFLVSQFDNPYAAAGILANIEAESSLEPTASQGNTPACGYGLCQWTQDRKALLNKFASLAETSIDDIDLQLCFIIYELDNYYPDLKQYLYDVGDGNLAASEFCAVYEQSAEYGNRGKYVSKYLQRFALTQ